jgi:hypothetical protein
MLHQALLSPTPQNIPQERAVTRRIFQALPTQTDTTIALIYRMDVTMGVFEHAKCA